MTTAADTNTATTTRNPGRLKFLFGGLLIIAAIVYLIASNTQSTQQYFYTIEELQSGSAGVGENVRISGAVLGDSIDYDAESLELRFTIVNVPGDQDEINAQGGLAAVLHAAVEDPTNARMSVLYTGPLPDLMQHEAQAIMDGHIGDDGVFYADTLLLKCPTRYEDDLTDQTASVN